MPWHPDCFSDSAVLVGHRRSRAGPLRCNGGTAWTLSLITTQRYAFMKKHKLKLWGPRCWIPRVRAAKYWRPLAVDCSLLGQPNPVGCT
jgi:hypothetical protein